MQWEASENGGFCSPKVQPWLPVTEDVGRINVAAESVAKDSLLDLYRQLIALRSTRPALLDGSLEVLTEKESGRHLLGYRRQFGRDELLVLINFSARVARYDNRSGFREILLAVGIEKPGSLNMITLPARSALILARQ